LPAEEYSMPKTTIVVLFDPGEETLGRLFDALAV
jgi:hypothetical protein